MPRRLASVRILANRGCRAGHGLRFTVGRSGQRDRGRLCQQAGTGCCWRKSARSMGSGSGSVQWDPVRNVRASDYGFGAGRILVANVELAKGSNFADGVFAVGERRPAGADCHGYSEWSRWHGRSPGASDLGGGDAFTVWGGETLWRSAMTSGAVFLVVTPAFGSAALSMRRFSASCRKQEISVRYHVQDGGLDGRYVAALERGPHAGVEIFGPVRVWNSLPQRKGRRMQAINRGFDHLKPSGAEHMTYINADDRLLPALAVCGEHFP